MKTLAFFNNKGGVGKTSLVYHLAWMFADLKIPVLAIDLDPQSNLTSMFLTEARLEELWQENTSNTVADSLKPLIEGTGDISRPHVEKISPYLGLVAGKLELSKYEDDISGAWGDCFQDKPRGFRVMAGFYRIMLAAMEQHPAKIVLIDVGPNLGAINRSALIAADNVLIPLAPDLFSLQGLRNLGPTLRNWSSKWEEVQKKLPPDSDIRIPSGRMTPIGYVVMQHGVRDSRPVKANQRWLNKIPSVYREFVLNETLQQDIGSATDPYQLAQLKHYRSLMSLAQESNKPIFHLKPSDGAIGSHTGAVQDCYNDFNALAKKIAVNIALAID
jgi:chromosome partitioning protein